MASITSADNQKYPNEKHFVYSRHTAQGANALEEYLENELGWDRLSNNKADHGSNPPHSWRAERLPVLKPLILTYNAVDPVRLTCPILLRCLKHLVLNFAVSLQAPIDPRFSWVLHQLLLQRLEVMLQVHTSGTARHSAVLQALAPPSITRLTLQLELHAPFPAPVQILWNAVSVGSLTLQIPCGGLVGSNSYPLQPLV